MIDAIAERVRSIQSAVSRAAVTPLLVRCGVFLSTLASFALAVPAEIFANQPLVLLIAAVMPALAPQRFWSTFAALLAIGGWLVSTAWYDERMPLWRLLGLATCLYLAHSLAALAALLPYDAVVAPEVPVRWVARALGVTLAAAVLAVLLLGLEQQWGGPTFLAASLGGLAVAVLAAALLGWLLRRR